MRKTAIIILALMCILLGCGNQSTPDMAVSAFVKAIGSRDYDKLATLVSDESQPMVKTNLSRSNGISLFAIQASSHVYGKNYLLVVDAQNSTSATVLLKNGQPGLPVFQDHSLPPNVKKNGLKFFLVKEDGQWKINLLSSEDELFNIGIEYIEKRNGGKLPSAFPTWMPSPPGLPSPPGYKEF